MQTLNYWKQFENTGKITDYLSYKENSGHTERKSIADTSGTVTPDGAARVPYPREAGVYLKDAGIY